MYLRLARINGICSAALSFHQKDLAVPYNEYINANNPLGDESYNYEQDDFISKLYPASLPMPRPQQDIVTEDYFLNYDKINSLFEYIFQVKYLYKRQREYFWQHYSAKSLGGILNCFQKADSKLMGICQNTVDRTCTISLSNVVTYGEGRIDKSEDVNITDIAICFKNVSSVRINGVFRYELLGIHYISESWLSKESDTEYCFSVLSPIDKEGFIIEVVFTNYSIDVKPHLYYAKNCL